MAKMYNPYRIISRGTKGEFLRRAMFWPGYAVVYTCQIPNFPETSNPKPITKKDLVSIVVLEGFKLLAEAAFVFTTYDAISKLV